MEAPIIVFVYNRLEHTKRLLEDLNRCLGIEQHDLYIFSDAPKTSAVEAAVGCVREYLRQYKKESLAKTVTVREAEENKGLAKSIITGVTEVINRYGTAIILEDDLRLSNDFLSFMQDCLEYYREDRLVGAISGFSLLPESSQKRRDFVYKSRTGNSWGWATWKEVWNNVDWSVADYDSFKNDKLKRDEFDRQQEGISEMLDRQMQGKIDSWAVRWDYHFYRNKLWTIYPFMTKIANEGFDGTGVHCAAEGGSKEQKAKSGLYTLIPVEECQDLTKKTSGNTLKKMMKKKVKICLRKVRGGLVRILLLFNGIGAEIGQKYVKHAYKVQFKLKWTYLNPIFFDHRIDLYYKWGETQSPEWLKRGVLSNTRIREYEHAKVLELGCGDGFNTYHFYCDKNVDSVLACDFSSEAIKFANRKYGCDRIRFIEADLRKSFPTQETDYTNVICDAAVNCFTIEELRGIFSNIARAIADRKGTFSGTAQCVGKNLWGHYVTNFESPEQFKGLLEEFFSDIDMTIDKTEKETVVYFSAKNN